MISHLLYAPIIAALILAIGVWCNREERKERYDTETRRQLKALRRINHPTCRKELYK